MIPYAAYKVLHLFGIVTLFLALGALALLGIHGDAARSAGVRKLAAITHGVALFLVLLGGFGLLARIGIVHGAAWPGWVWAKLGIWLLLGAAIVVPYRFPRLARPLWFILPVLGGIAAYMAIYKPF